MIEFSFAFTTALVVLGWLVFRLCCCLKAHSFSAKHEALQLLFLVNLMVISRFVFHPMATVDGRVQPLIFDAAALWPPKVVLTPFVPMLDHESIRDALVNLIGNFTMFIPTGILIPLLYKHLASFQKTVLTGFWISLAIEIIQLPFASRYSDVNDLILNTLGVAAGYGIWTLARKLICRRKKETL